VIGDFLYYLLVHLFFVERGNIARVQPNGLTEECRGVSGVSLLKRMTYVYDDICSWYLSRISSGVHFALFLLPREEGQASRKK